MSATPRSAASEHPPIPARRRRIVARPPRGAVLVEYALVLVLIVLMSVGAVYTTGEKTAEIYCHASQALRGADGECGPIEVAAAPDPSVPTDPSVPDTPTSPDPTEEGGGQGIGSQDQPAATPPELLAAFADVVLAKGKGKSSSQLRYARFKGTDTWTFTVEPLGSLAGDWAACLGTCAASGSDKGTSVTFEASQGLRVGYRFLSTDTVLVGLDGQVRFTLTSSGGQVWTDTITVKREASPVGITALKVDDIVFKTGTNTGFQPKVDLGLEGADTASWRFDLEAVGFGGNARVLYRMKSSSLVEEGVSSATSTTVWSVGTQQGAGVTLGVYAPVREERYRGLRRTMRLTVTSVDDPSITQSVEFEVRREAAPERMPVLEIAETTAAPDGTIGRVLVPFTFNGDAESRVVLEALTDAKGNKIAPTLFEAYTAGNEANPVRVSGASRVMEWGGQPIVGGKISVPLPGGLASFQDGAWEFSASAISPLFADVPVTTYAVTRKALALNMIAQFEDVEFPVGLTAASDANNGIQVQPFGTSHPKFPVEVVLRKVGGVSPMAARLCVRTTCTSMASTASTAAVSGVIAASQPDDIRLEFNLNTNPDVLQEIRQTFEIEVGYQGGAKIKQTIEAHRPALIPKMPAIALADPALAEGIATAYTDAVITPYVDFRYPLIVQGNMDLRVVATNASTRLRKNVWFEVDGQVYPGDSWTLNNPRFEDREIAVTFVARVDMIEMPSTRAYGFTFNVEALKASGRTLVGADGTPFMASQYVPFRYHMDPVGFEAQSAETLTLTVGATATLTYALSPRPNLWLHVSSTSSPIFKRVCMDGVCTDLPKNAAMIPTNGARVMTVELERPVDWLASYSRYFTVGYRAGPNLLYSGLLGAPPVERRIYVSKP